MPKADELSSGKLVRKTGSGQFSWRTLENLTVSFLHGNSSRRPADSKNSIVLLTFPFCGLSASISSLLTSQENCFQEEFPESSFLHDN